MWLVLCSTSDPAGLWAYQGLRQLGVAPLELVTAESLADGTRWEHRLDDSGIHLKITLPDGRMFCSSRIRGALNRLLGPSPEALRRGVPSDREYAQAELFAFYLSWLNGLPGEVINRPTPQGLSGRWFPLSEWVYRASRAGLPTPAYRLNGRDAPDQGYQSLVPDGAVTLSLITLRGEVFGGLVPEGIKRACGRLAEEAGADILGVELYSNGNYEWTFASATATPDLSRGGMPLLQHLAQILTQGAQS